MLTEYLQQMAPVIDEALNRYLPAGTMYPAEIHQAMRYSIFAGGKRLRPIMVIAAAQAIGCDVSTVLPAACALEMVHTYSLIHDDLPEMDDDDYRRGKLTNHKMFGQGMAVLAGDALLTQAFILAKEQRKLSASDVVLDVWTEIAEGAGTLGMIGGQVVDLASENKQIAPDVMEYIHRAKTGALFKAAVRAGARLGGASRRQLEDLTMYAEAFGLAFQITDDILDVVGDEQKMGKPVGSDEKNHKSTYPALYGLDQARQMAQDAVKQAKDCLTSFADQALILAELVDYLAVRES